VVTYFGLVFINIRDKVSYFRFYFICAVKPMSVTGQSVVQKVFDNKKKFTEERRKRQANIRLKENKKEPCQNTKLIF
jgi:hypothetical protein